MKTIGCQVEWHESKYGITVQGMVIGILQNGFLAVQVSKLDNTVIFVAPPGSKWHKTSTCRFIGE